MRLRNCYFLELEAALQEVRIVQRLTNQHTCHSMAALAAAFLGRVRMWLGGSSAMLIVAVCLLSPAQVKPTSAGDGQPGAQESGYVPVHKFDPKRDPASDIQAAITEAQRTNKRIILDVGGDWCSWCHVLDKFLEQHPEIVDLQEKNFITVAVFYGSENKNEKVLSRYPKVEGIPHFFVLEKDGTLLHSQGMIKLETGGEPDPEKMKGFLVKWSPPGAETAAKGD